MLDNGIACSIVGTVTAMSVDDVGNAAVIINSQAVAVILINIACSISSCTTGQLVDTAALELLAAPYARQNALLLVGPGCTVLQPQVYCTCKGLAITLLRYGLAAFGEFVVYNAGQLGILSGQANINLGFSGAIHIVYSTYGSNNVTGNINLVIACAGYLAVCILHGVYINLAVS